MPEIALRRSYAAPVAFTPCTPTARFRDSGSFWDDLGAFARSHGDLSWPRALFIVSRNSLFPYVVQQERMLDDLLKDCTVGYKNNAKVFTQTRTGD